MEILIGGDAQLSSMREYDYGYPKGNLGAQVTVMTEPFSLKEVPRERGVYSEPRTSVGVMFATGPAGPTADFRSLGVSLAKIIPVGQSAELSPYMVVGRRGGRDRDGFSPFIGGGVILSGSDTVSPYFKLEGTTGYVLEAPYTSLGIQTLSAGAGINLNF